MIRYADHFCVKRRLISPIGTQSGSPSPQAVDTLLPPAQNLNTSQGKLNSSGQYDARWEGEAPAEPLQEVFTRDRQAHGIDTRRVVFRMAKGRSVGG